MPGTSLLSQPLDHLRHLYDKDFAEAAVDLRNGTTARLDALVDRVSASPVVAHLRDIITSDAQSNDQFERQLKRGGLPPKLVKGLLLAIAGGALIAAKAPVAVLVGIALIAWAILGHLRGHLDDLLAWAEAQLDKARQEIVSWL